MAEARIYVRKDPATYQAFCEDCGWHTWPQRNEPFAERLAEAHRSACPNPPPPRNGAMAECGCWSHASAGSAAGETRDRCPLHGVVLLVQCNVPEPEGERTSLQWTRPNAATLAQNGER